MSRKLLALPGPVSGCVQGKVIDVRDLVISVESTSRSEDPVFETPGAAEPDLSAPPAPKPAHRIAPKAVRPKAKKVKVSPKAFSVSRLSKVSAKGPGLWQGRRRLGVAAAVARPGGQDAEEKDPNSSNLLLPESSDLNRILEKATEFFSTEPARWEDGIEFIQGLLEDTAQVEIGPDHLNDPRYSVYSGDSRLYIPFTEYCQGLLASLPPEGLEVYRGLTDGRAGTAFRKAAAEMDVTRLQELSRVYFATSYGPKILSLLADLATLQGNLPKAVFLRARLLDTYPDLSEADTSALLLRQLQAHALLGDLTSFEDTLQRMRSLAPDAEYRVAGELVPLDELPELPEFHIRESNILTELENAPRTAGNTEGMDLTHLVPMWDFRFFDGDPYHLRKKKSTNRNSFWMGGRGAMYVPKAKDARPGIFGTAFDARRGRRFAIKDHENLVILDMLSGIPVARDPDESHKKRGPSSTSNRNQLRVRLPANDYAQQKVGLVDGDLYLTIKNRVGTGRGSFFPYTNRLMRYRPGQESWEVLSQASPTSAAEKVYYEGPPIGYGDWLYAPIRKKKSYGLAKLRESDGKLLSVVTVHSGGSRYLRPPAVTPIRIGHQILHLTNAGCVASFSLPNLELRWLRRYETWMRLQPPPRVRPSNTRMWSGVRVEGLRFWDPVDPIVVGDKIVVAPVDADTLLCLDIQSGEMEWILPRSEKSTRGVQFKQVLGPLEGRIYLIGNHIQCVDVPSGKRMWEVEIEGGAVFGSIGSKVEGLGTLVGDQILLPLKSGKVAVFATQDGHFERLLDLPTLRVGEKGIEAPFNLQVDGPVLLALSEIRVAAFTVPSSLLAGAGDDLDRVDRLLVSGQGAAARNLLGDLLVAQTLSDPEAAAGRKLYIRLTGEVCRQIKGDRKPGTTEAAALDQALAILDEADKRLGATAAHPIPEFLLFRINLLMGSGRNKELRDMREILAGIDVDKQETHAPDAGAKDQERR